MGTTRLTDAQLYLDLRRARDDGTLTPARLRSGVATLADNLADRVPRGIATTSAGVRYEVPHWMTTGLTRAGRGLGRDIFVPYQGRVPHASDADLNAFLDEYPAVVRGFSREMSIAARDLDALWRAAAPGRAGMGD